MNMHLNPLLIPIVVVVVVAFGFFVGILTAAARIADREVYGPEWDAGIKISCGKCGLHIGGPPDGRVMDRNVLCDVCFNRDLEKPIANARQVVNAQGATVFADSAESTADNQN